MVLAHDSTSDAIAAEVVLSLREAFPLVAVSGVTGPYLESLSVTSVASIDAFKGPFYFLKKKFLYKKIVSYLEENSIKVLFLVGQSPLSQQVAKFCQKKKIPVYFMSPSPLCRLEDHKKDWVKFVCQKAFSFIAGCEGSGFGVKDYAKVLGFPFYARFSKIKIDPSHLGFSKDQKIITMILPSGRKSALKALKRFKSLAPQISKSNPDAVFVASYEGGDYHQDLLNEAKAGEGQVEVFKNMVLECLAISQVAITYNELDSLKASMLSRPHILFEGEVKDAYAFYRKDQKDMIPRFKEQEASLEEVSAKLNSLFLLESMERAKMLSSFSSITKNLLPMDHGMLIDQVAEHLVRKGLSRRNRSQR